MRVRVRACVCVHGCAQTCEYACSWYDTILYYSLCSPARQATPWYNWLEEGRTFLPCWYHPAAHLTSPVTLSLQTLAMWWTDPEVQQASTVMSTHQTSPVVIKRSQQSHVTRSMHSASHQISQVLLKLCQHQGSQAIRSTETSRNIHFDPTIYTLLSSVISNLIISSQVMITVVWHHHVPTH